MPDQVLGTIKTRTAPLAVDDGDGVTRLTEQTFVEISFGDTGHTDRPPRSVVLCSESAFSDGERIVVSGEG